MNTPAPLFAEIADGPRDGEAFWLTAKDDVRLRIGIWNRKAAQKGTVFLFPGRTEYIEKYGRAASDLARYGYATLTIDWRGQGLSDRLTTDPMSGHVLSFDDYQMDVAALVASAHAMNLPHPWHLLAHSMGGCIGLRALMDSMPVTSCVFSGPMWGIHMAPALRPVAWTASWLGKVFGLGRIYAPGSADDSYVLTEPFETNKLTRDREMYQYMIDQLNAQPALGLGGPSLRWLHEALTETRDLSRRPSPRLPCLTVLGDDEEIVDVPRIYDRIARWPGALLEVEPGGRHEVLMEDQATRARLFDLICEFFQQPEVRSGN